MSRLTDSLQKARMRTGFVLDTLLAHPVRTNFGILTVGILLLIFYAWIFGSAEGWTFKFAGFELGGRALRAVAVLCKELGLAAVVAVTLNFSIEAFNRRRHAAEQEILLNALADSHQAQKDELIEKIQQQHRGHLELIHSNLLEVVYKRSIPDSIFREVERWLLNGNFVRCESTYYYTIKKFDDKYVKLRVKHLYTVQNISPLKERYTLRIGFDVIRHMADEYAVINLKNGDAEQASGIEVKKTNKSGHHQWWEAELACDVEPGATIQCEFEYVRISTIKGKEAICTMMPAKQLSVMVIDPQERFAIRSMCMHPSGEQDLSFGDPITHHWKVKGALLPGQGLLFDWMPKEDLLPVSIDERTADQLTSAEKESSFDVKGGSDA